MAEDTKKINEIARKFGHLLINSGISMVRSAYDLKPKEYLGPVIQDTLKAIIGVDVSTADGKIYLVNWNTIEWIKDLDLTDKLIYYNEVFDCDDFAFHFSSLISTLYLLNNCGVAFGNLYDYSGKFIGRHAFNIIATDENGKLEFRIFEPMNDKWAKITGKRTDLGFGWIYEPSWVIFF